MQSGLFGGAFVLFFLGMVAVAVVGTVLWVVALVDLLRRPSWQWAAAGQNQVVWALVVVLGHLVGAIVYWLVARPALRRVEGMAPPFPGWPPAPPPAPAPHR